MAKSQKAALPNTLKKKNYFSILNEFRNKEALSANDISARTGISRATAMKAINHFMEKGLVESAGKGSSTEIGGKRPELFQFCMRRYLTCVGLYEDNMLASVFDLTGTLLAKRTVKFYSENSVEDFLDTVYRLVEELLEEVPDGRRMLYGISLFVGGVLEEETGVLRYSVITPGWGRNIPLKELLSRRFPGVEILVDNVARMAACAAVLDCAAYEEKRVAVLYTERGASACYIDRGHVLHGPNNLIGEIGPMILSLSEMNPYERGNRAFFSTLISEETVRQKLKNHAKTPGSSILETPGKDLKLNHILDAAENGDLMARAVVKDTAWAFSAALHNIALNFDPEIVIIQGNYACAGEWFVDCIREGMACFPRNTEEISFEIVFDKRPLIELQMLGGTKLLTRRFFSSAEWI